MKFNLNDYDRDMENKIITIPDEELTKLMTTLDIDKSEAIEIWLTDEGYISNEEQDALDKKAKDNRITATIHQAKSETAREKRKVERKEDPDKENLISWLAQFLNDNVSVENLKVTNIGKLIEFEYLGNAYKLDLVKRRKPKN